LRGGLLLRIDATDVTDTNTLLSTGSPVTDILAQNAPR
jgi:hypothetical protein